MSSITATSLYSDSTFHPRIRKHFANRPQIFFASFANYPQFTRKETEGLQIATFPDLRFYWSCFPCALNIAPSFLPRSISLLDILGQAFEFKVMLQALQVEGQRTVPAAPRSCFTSTNASAERGASYCVIHCTHPHTFASLSKNRIKGNISCKRKTI